MTLWRELAEAAAQLKKGDPLLVQGRLMNEAWTDRDGNKRNSTKVEATRVEVLTRGAGAGSPAATPVAARGATGTATRSTGSRSGGLDIDQGLDNFPPEEEDLPF